MDIIKLDSVALSMLRFLNENSYLKPKTLALVFYEKYTANIEDAITTLVSLKNQGYVSIREFEDDIRIIQMEHLGKNYDKILIDDIDKYKREKVIDIKSKIIILLLGALSSLCVSIITNLLFK